MERTGQKWSREETILAFALYCRTPFGKITQQNKDIIELAEIIGRTPGSVGLKMHNLAHHDPELQARNVKAMSHGSKLDGIIFNEFSTNLEELSFQEEIIKKTLFSNVSTNVNYDLNDLVLPAGTVSESQVKVRVGQNFFRDTVLNAYDRRCCITGIDNAAMLIASHIKPWKVSNIETERTNPRNGLCLNAFHDKAFDKGLITLDKHFKVVLSPLWKEINMDEATKEWFFSYGGKEIRLPDKFIPSHEFIEYHNDVIFLK